MKKKDVKKMEKLLKEYRAIEIDLSETTIGVDLDYQVERLKKNNDRMDTEIHGGGTGKD